MRDLWKKNLVPFSRVTALERDAARLEGERGALIAAIAQAKGKIAEIELKILQIDQDLRTEVGKELPRSAARRGADASGASPPRTSSSASTFARRRTAWCIQLNVHTVGGVVQAGEPIMLIVPDGDTLIVEAKVPPQEIDQVACRPDGRAALHRLQPAHDARARRRGRPCRRRRHAGRAHRRALLRGRAFAWRDGELARLDGAEAACPACRSRSSSRRSRAPSHRFSSSRSAIRSPGRSGGASPMSVPTHRGISWLLK